MLNIVTRKKILMFLVPIIIVLALALMFTSGYSEQPTQADDGLPDADYWLNLQTEMPLPGFIVTPVPMSQRTYIDNPANYHIVYLSAPGAIHADSLIVPTGLFRSAMQAEIVHSWNDVMQAHARRPIQSIIIHRSAAGMVDPAWLRSAGTNGVVIVLLNLHYADYGEMIDSHCIRQEAREMVNPFEGKGDYYYLAVGLSLANNPAEQPLVDAALYDTCSRDPAITGGVMAWGSASHNLINADYEIGNLTDMIISMINMVRSQRQAYNNRGRPPTQVPSLPN